MLTLEKLLNNDDYFLFGTTTSTLVLPRVPTICREAAPDVASLPADIAVHRVALDCFDGILNAMVKLVFYP